MRIRLIFLLHSLLTQLAAAPILTALGLAGVGLGILCLMAALVLGVEIPPEGDFLDTASFNGAVGIFILTLAILVRGVSWRPAAYRRWTAWLVGLTIYSYGIETVQAFRGLDPRFSQAAGPLDRIAGGIFFLAALGIMVCFILLALKYFCQAPTPVSLAVRYASVAAMLAFGVGIYMSLVTKGRHVPEEGNLLFLHAAGFHGLQAVPLVALFLKWGSTPVWRTRRWVHTAGLVWLGACLAIAWQSISGSPLFSPSPAMIAANLFFVLWLIAFIVGLRAWLKTPAPEPRQLERTRK